MYQAYEVAPELVAVTLTVAPVHAEGEEGEVETFPGAEPLLATVTTLQADCPQILVAFTEYVPGLSVAV